MTVEWSLDQITALQRASAVTATPLPYDEARAAHIEHLRGWSMLAVQGHEGAQAVMNHPDVVSVWGSYQHALTTHGLAPPAPRAPRPSPSFTPTPALAGATRRAGLS
jgi:hypothetical protein